MPIEIDNPELEQRMREEIAAGDVESVEDLLMRALEALRREAGA